LQIKQVFSYDAVARSRSARSARSDPQRPDCNNYCAVAVLFLGRCLL